MDLLRRAFQHVKEQHPFVIDAAVILPDHLHCIWTLPVGDADFSLRWRLIKTWFTKHFRGKSQFDVNSARARKHGQAVWQHRYWEHLIRDDWDFEQHVHYIHYNPVKHGYVLRPIDWQYSSIHRYIAQGILSAD